ncbi:MAG: hypothetical protein JWO88_860 [Frankiales bacterium]|nr:hypothetical protein [Frankiales bacterium]
MLRRALTMVAMLAAVSFMSAGPALAAGPSATRPVTTMGTPGCC